MKLSSLIGHSVELLKAVRKSPYPADSIIATFFRTHTYLGSHDRRFISNTVYGVLRHLYRLELTAELSVKSDTVARESDEFFAFICLIYLTRIENITPSELQEKVNDNPQLLEMITRIPDTLVTPAAEEDPITQLSVIYSFPAWLVEMWIAKFGTEETEKLCTVMNTPSTVTLRVNTLKTTVEACQAALAAEGVATSRTKFSPVGLVTEKRINIFQVKVFLQGYFEVQDEGSQLLSLLVDPKPRDKVIDACAGGGGKTLALAALMKNHGEIFAFDINEHRLKDLHKRLRRAGGDNVRLLHIGKDGLPPHYIGIGDTVLVDAPCSGIGTLRRNPGMKWDITRETITELSVKQFKILTQYSVCVRPGGKLVYATCTTASEENEEVIEQFLEANRDFELVSPSEILARYNLSSLVEGKYFQLFPHIHGTDGFFAAVMKRKKKIDVVPQLHDGSITQ